uniref:Reverse transcriptase domain-containing protein n=1 Tax=Globodera pallida TaxID=36090 RepID=A0A183CPI0_GLOPA
MAPDHNETPTLLTHSPVDHERGDGQDRTNPVALSVMAAAARRVSSKPLLQTAALSGVTRTQKVQRWSKVEEEALQELVPRHTDRKGTVRWIHGVYTEWCGMHRTNPRVYMQRPVKSLSEKWVKLRSTIAATVPPRGPTPSNDQIEVSGMVAELPLRTARLGAGDHELMGGIVEVGRSEEVDRPSLLGDTNPVPSEAKLRKAVAVRDIVPVRKRKHANAKNVQTSARELTKRPRTEKACDTSWFQAESQLISDNEIPNLVRQVEPLLADALGWAAADAEPRGVAVPVPLKREFNQEVKRIANISSDRLYRRGRIPLIPFELDRERVAQLEQLVVDRVERCIAKGPDWFLGLNVAIFAAARILSRRKRTENLTDRLQRNDAKTLKEIERKQARLLRAAKRDRHRKWRSRSAKEREIKVERLRQMAGLVEQRIAERRDREASGRVRRRYRWRPSLRSITEPSATPSPAPSEQQTQQFWQALWGKKGHANTKQWQLREFERHVVAIRREVNQQTYIDTEQLVKMFALALQKAKGSKAPGPDGIRVSWWKMFRRVVPYVSAWVVRVLRGAEPVASWLCKGLTVLLPKGGDSTNPSNYRPITCLNTCYKLLTSVITQLIEQQVELLGGLPRQQVALRRGVQGTSVALLTDALVIADAAKANRHLGVCWFDFKKAFDSVPHNLILWMLRVIGVPDDLRSNIRAIMDLWATQLKVGGRVIGDAIPVRTGVFQGDTLSPLLFCLCVWPISFVLDQTPQYHFRCMRHLQEGFSIGHVFYMDDLKCYCMGKGELTQVVERVQECTSALGLSINHSKSAWLNSDGARGEMVGVPSLVGNYKYLGLQESLGLAARESLEVVQGKFMGRLKAIWSSQLSFGQSIHATKTICWPIVQYVLVNLFWSRRELTEMRIILRKWDRQVRDLLDECGVRQKSRSKNELYVERCAGGWGFPSLEDLLENTLAVQLSVLLARDEMAMHLKVCEMLERKKICTPLSAGRQVLDDWGVKVEVRERTLFLNGVLVEPAQVKRKLLEAMATGREQTRLAKWTNRKSRYGMTGGTWREASYVDVAASNEWLVKGALSKNVVSSCLAVRGNM